MHKAVSDAHEDLDAVENEETNDELSAEENNLVATVATVGVVAIGAAVFEAALLPGLALGVVAVAAPKFAPKHRDEPTAQLARQKAVASTCATQRRKPVRA